MKYTKFSLSTFVLGLVVALGMSNATASPEQDSQNPLVDNGLVSTSTSYQFNVIIDSTNPSFGDFGTYPSINDSGVVAFHGEQGVAAPGTYKSDGTAAPILISDDAGGGGPFINNLGEVASRRWPGSQVEFFKGSGGGTTTIAQTGVANGTFRTFPGYVYLADDTGIAVFSAELNPYNPRVRGIYTGVGNATTDVVVDNTGPFAYFGNNPTVNNAGTVVFTASLDNTDEGLFVGSVGGHGVTSTVILASTSPLYRFDGSPSINNQGQIAFKANEDATGMPAIFVINSDGSNLRMVATASGPYSQFQAPIINDAGTVAFLAFTDAGGRGIFTGPDPVADKVIAEGDPLFGSTVASVSFFRGLNNNGDIAFYYTLADQRKGIARAKVATPAIVPVSAVSRKMSGASGPFDVNLPLTGATGVECRSGGATGDHQLFLTFSSPVAVNGSPQAQITSGSGLVGTAGSSNGGVVTINGSTLTIPLTSIANAQTITVTLFGVSDGTNTANVPVSMRVLLGDTTGNGVVNASDLSQTKGQAGQSITSSNFRVDVNANGTINATDVAIVKSQVGTSIP